MTSQKWQKRWNWKDCYFGFRLNQWSVTVNIAGTVLLFPFKMCRKPHLEEW